MGGLPIESELARLERQKKDMHEKLMQEQQRAAKSKANGNPPNGSILFELIQRIPEK